MDLNEPSGAISSTPDEPSGDDIDTGEPIEILAELGAAPSRGFLGRLRRRIDRRRLSTDLTDLTWNAPLVVFMEFIDMAFRFLTGRTGPEGGRD